MEYNLRKSNDIYSIRLWGWLISNSKKNWYQRKALKKKVCFLLEFIFFLKIGNYGHKNIRTKCPEIPIKELNLSCSD